MREKSAKRCSGCSGGRKKNEDLEACGPGRAVAEMEQPSSGVDLEASRPGKAVVEMEQPCLGADLEACGPREMSVKRTSVPKSKSYRKGSFPKCPNVQCQERKYA